MSLNFKREYMNRDKKHTHYDTVTFILNNSKTFTQVKCLDSVSIMVSSLNDWIFKLVIFLTNSNYKYSLIFPSLPKGEYDLNSIFLFSYLL